MKKKYTSPEAEIVLFETEEEVMDGADVGGSEGDPFSMFHSIRLVELPNGTILDEHGMPTNIPR